MAETESTTQFTLAEQEQLARIRHLRQGGFVPSLIDCDFLLRLIERLREREEGGR